MSDFVKGEIVEATAQFYGYDVRADKRGRHENRWVTPGMELEVTAVGQQTLNVRYAQAGWERNVFRIPRDAVRRVRQVGVAPEGMRPLDDPSIAWFWEDAARLAERFGFCDEFDRLADALGAPGRERTFRVPMIDEDGIRVTATVTARSRRLAEARIRERIARPASMALPFGVEPRAVEGTLS